ncbi:LRC15 protein, partial [Crypturellus undulatus]|nr:LRC15 protein [Crypturellus undulatus]
CPRACQCAPETETRCGRAGLSALPASIAASTVSLNLSHNSLRALSPNAFGNLTALHRLWLDGNSLTFLAPGTFLALGQLRELHLGGNARLTSLHPNAFRGLRNLTSLDLSRCNIFEIHPLLFSHLPNLEKLDLAANNMRYVPQAFGNLSRLAALLYLNNNQLSSLTRSAFARSAKLHLLHLSKNNLSSLP